MNVLVTGGAGFIGSHLAEALLEAGHKVVVIDDLSTGSRKNVPSKVKFHRVDIGSAVVDKIFEKGKFDCVFHLAAQTSVSVSMKNALRDAEVNILGGIYLLRAAGRHGVKKFIFSSSVAVYGEQKSFPARESHPQNPVNPYGLSKLTFERYLSFFGRNHGFQYISLRYSNVYGPRQNSLGEAGVIAVFCSRLAGGQKVIIYSDGRQTRDFIFVKDVVRANLMALKFKGSGEFNIGTSKETNINQLYETIAKLNDSDVRANHVSPRAGDQRRSCIAFDKAKRALRWSPKAVLSAGLEETVSYFQSEASTLDSF